MSPGARTPALLEWARTLQALAQNGLTFSRDPFDRERHPQLQELGGALAVGRLAACGRTPEPGRAHARPARVGAHAAGARAARLDLQPRSVRSRALHPAAGAGCSARARTDRG